jgi:hypothetical protein
MALDGTRAFVVGDYVTPRTGPYAGKLGPWANLVSAAGINPRSPAMKAAHVVLGIGWLAAAACFAARLPWAGWAIAGCGAASLWYLPFGTVIGIVQLGLILTRFFRGT